MMYEEFIENGVDEYYQPNNKTMSNIFSLHRKDVAGAAISSILVALISYILMVGDVFILDWHTVVNTGVMAGLGSLLKNLLTTDDGRFAGLVVVK